MTTVHLNMLTLSPTLRVLLTSLSLFCTTTVHLNMLPRCVLMTRHALMCADYDPREEHAQVFFDKLVVAPMDKYGKDKVLQLLKDTINEGDKCLSPFEYWQTDSQ